MPDIHLQHTTAVTLDAREAVFDDATLVIADARFVYVGPAEGAPAPRADDQVIDASGKVAIPGLVNAHTHLAMTLFRGAADDLPPTPYRCPS